MLDVHSGAQDGMHRRVMHKRQRVSTTTHATTAAGKTTTTHRATTTTTAIPTAVVGAVTDLVGAPASSSSVSFQPGVAASGTATRSVGDAPPTRTHSSVSTSYPYSFANQATLSYSSSNSTASPAAGSPAAGSASALPQGAIIGIAAGGGVLGVLILAGIGWCCWKKRKGKDDDDLGWTNLGEYPNAPGAAKQAAEPSGLDKWASNDGLASDPYSGGAKPWAQQSNASFSSFDEKGPTAHSHVLPVFAPQNQLDARAELLGAPGRSATQQSFPRSATNASVASAPADRARPETNAHSVNDVIAFDAAPPHPTSMAYPPSPAPAHLASRGAPASPTAGHAQYPLSSATPQQPPRANQAQHLSLNGVPVSPQPITASNYPPHRPMRPSEIPSVAPGASPYAFARRPEQAQRDTQELASDERLAGRFMEVMTGQVGREEGVERRDEGDAPSGKSKKDTILGLTDAYGGEEDVDEEEELDQVDPTFPPAQLPRRTSSRKRHPAPSTSRVDLPSHPSAAATRSSPPTNPRRYSARVDSKPLRELEAMFEQLPPSSQHHGVRASEASDLSGLAAAAGVRLGGSSSESYRTSDASSMYTTPQQSSASAPLAFTRHPLGTVPESESKDSLSPLSAAAAAGAQSPYGEPRPYEHSIYSAAGEVGELSSNSLAGSAGSSPAKSANGASLAQRPSASQPSTSAQGGASAGDVFGSAPAISVQPPVRKSSIKASASVQRKLSTRPSAPAPLRLAQRDASTGEERNPLTLSTAERDVLHQLGLPGTPALSSASSSPASSLGTPGSSILATPQTPVFHLSRPSHDAAAHSFMDVSQSPSPSPSRDAFATQQHKPPVLAFDSLAAGGFKSLAVMAAGKGGAQDASYRSATMSLYGMYE